jgi:LAO/AO transport system kinase
MISAADILAGKRLAISRFLTEIENDTPEGRKLMNALFSCTGKAYFIGVTGAPGTGKSSLVNELVQYIRNQTDWRIAILAVDPSSPFSGGALLGDRIRMRDLYGDERIFIRSMASRGALGGLAVRTTAVASALDASGFDVIIIETVGAGQSEVDITRLADTVLVVEAPGLGDDIQAIKAGILEIADIFVVNKADQAGADNAVRALESMLQLSANGNHKIADLHHGFVEKLNIPNVLPETDPDDCWQVPVIKTSTTAHMGIDLLFNAMMEHRSYLEKSGLLKSKGEQRALAEFQLMLSKALLDRWQAAVDTDKFQNGVRKLLEREISPQELADQFVKLG